MRSRALAIGLSVGLAGCGSSPPATHGPVVDGGGSETSSDGSAGPTEAGADATPAREGGPTDNGPFPLGATLGATALHLRVRADAATHVEADLYKAATGVDESSAVVMTRAMAGDPWAADVPLASLAGLGLSPPFLYGYRAWGPNWTYDPTWSKGSAVGFVADVDAQGNRFDPNKLLLDPYTREMSHDPLQPSQTSSAPYTTGTANGTTDDGRVAPKSIPLAAAPPSTRGPPVRPLADDVIYEVHVRGLTMNDPSVGASMQGTFAGAATKAPALKALGVTAIELLPIQETQNDTNDEAQSGANYWGYSTLAFFAPDRRYSSDKSVGGPTREFKAMVDAFHAAGIKVLLDVVYNHTAEGGVSSTNPGSAKLLSFRGLDNAAYYELAA